MRGSDERMCIVRIEMIDPQHRNHDLHCVVTASSEDGDTVQVLCSCGEYSRTIKFSLLSTSDCVLDGLRAELFRDAMLEHGGLQSVDESVCYALRRIATALEIADDIGADVLAAMRLGR